MARAKSNGYAGIILSGAIMKTNLTPLQNKRDSNSPDSISKAPLVPDNMVTPQS